MVFQAKGMHTYKVPEGGSFSNVMDWSPASCSLKPPSRVCDLCSVIGPNSLKGPMLNVIRCFTILKFLIILFLNLSFKGEAQWDKGACIGAVKTGWWPGTHAGASRSSGVLQAPRWLWSKLGPTSGSSRTYHGKPPWLLMPQSRPWGPCRNINFPV